MWYHARHPGLESRGQTAVVLRSVAFFALLEGGALSLAFSLPLRSLCYFTTRAFSLRALPLFFRRMYAFLCVFCLVSAAL